MEKADIQRLIDLNNAFYQAHHASFSDTRKNPWPGWLRVADALVEGGAALRILDVACGNMRFERFMAHEHPDAQFEFTCVDSCKALAENVPGALFIERDVLASLLEHPRAPEGPALFDAAVSFGFMHHIPTYELRASFVRMLLSTLRERGLLALSFWRFMDDERLAEKACHTTREKAAALELRLEAGDYLLGWNDEPGACRYCHHFDDGELNRMIADLEDVATVAARFSADGRSGALNEYLLFKRSDSDAPAKKTGTPDGCPSRVFE